MWMVVVCYSYYYLKCPQEDVWNEVSACGILSDCEIVGNILTKSSKLREISYF